VSGRLGMRCAAGLLGPLCATPVLAERGRWPGSGGAQADGKAPSKRREGATRARGERSTAGGQNVGCSTRAADVGRAFLEIDLPGVGALRRLCIRAKTVDQHPCDGIAGLPTWHIWSDTEKDRRGEHGCCAYGTAPDQREDWQGTSGKSRLTLCTVKRIHTFYRNSPDRSGFRK
jgi:hypothetical protein